MNRFILLVILALSLRWNCTSRPPQESYTNPILSGFYPDPSICRVANESYWLTSTFGYFPAIPVFSNTDLVHWRPIGQVMNRPERLNLDGLGVSCGIFAPAIRPHRSTLYVTCTLVDGGGNFAVTAANPEGPWSDPVWLPEINGIDPSLFFDDGGGAHIVYNPIPPDNAPLFEGHRTIRMWKFDADRLSTGPDEIILVNGGADISKKPVWIEAPHLFHRDGWYLLIAAEGGTAEGHSEVVFRHQAVERPYLPRDKNPILTQRQLDPRRPSPITSTGHAARNVAGGFSRLPAISAGGSELLQHRA